MTFINKKVVKGTEYPSGSTEYDVKVSPLGEIATISPEREESVWATYLVSNVAATAMHMLIDLSDTSTWPHSSTGEINISQLRVSIDRDSSATGSVSIGVVTEVDATDGSASFFFRTDFRKSNTRRILTEVNYSPSLVKLGVTGGALDSGITNDSLASSVLLQTDVTLSSPGGSKAPAVGDVVLYLVRSAGQYNVTVECLYTSKS